MRGTVTFVINFEVTFTELSVEIHKSLFKKLVICQMSFGLDFDSSTFFSKIEVSLNTLVKALSEIQHRSVSHWDLHYFKYKINSKKLFAI